MAIIPYICGGSFFDRTQAGSSLGDEHFKQMSRGQRENRTDPCRHVLRIMVIWCATKMEYIHTCTMIILIYTSRCVMLWSFFLSYAISH